MSRTERSPAEIQKVLRHPGKWDDIHDRSVPAEIRNVLRHPRRKESRTMSTTDPSPAEIRNVYRHAGQEETPKLRA